MGFKEKLEEERRKEQDRRLLEGKNSVLTQELTQKLAELRQVCYSAYSVEVRKRAVQSNLTGIIDNPDVSEALD